ncbi:MAG TPA: CstA-like transporter-associated (seleno)protein [Candidatus Margulisiibacteriota bacterium]|nr:CstA-like transporter-associated (seleno)protein [Candidatus Margulisiibacteriota bacterium]
MTAKVRENLSRAAAHVRAALRFWSGDDGYERYVRRCAAGGQRPLDRGRYFAQRCEERYRSASRCC